MSITPSTAALRRGALAATAAALALSAGCRQAGAESGTIGADRFVEVNVALRTIPDTVTDLDSARVAVLEAHGVTAEDLHAFLEARTHDVAALASTWRRISERVDSLALERPQPGAPELTPEPWEEAGDAGPRPPRLEVPGAPDAVEGPGRATRPPRTEPATRPPPPDRVRRTPERDRDGLPLLQREVPESGRPSTDPPPPQ